MIRYFIFFVLVSLVQQVSGQDQWHDFTGKQKAFFFQLTRKIENLKPEVFHLFEFTDSIPYINDTLPDYPYIEQAIEADSSKLICHFEEMARKNRGLLMDIGTHYGSWELDLLLQFKNSEKPQYQYLKSKVITFEKLVLKNAPSASAKMWSNDTYTLAPEVARYYSPNLSIEEKIAALKNSDYNPDEKITLLNAIYMAQEEYIALRAKEIVSILTSKSINSNNHLIAAGDGKNWNELESVIRTKYNRPLPDPKAFFKYDLIGKRVGKSDQKTIVVSQNTVLKMKTVANMQTHLHTDVWAYHPQRQTTLIIQKGGNSYVLYGNNNNRYLSPDNSFEEGTTYAGLIDELENVWIADLKERIYGKRGFDYLIALYEGKIKKTRLKIKKTEQKLNEIRYTPEGPPKMKKKKKSRKQRKKGKSISYQDNQGVPRGKMSKTAKKRQIEQHNLIGYEGQLQTELATLKQLKKEKEEAFDLLASYEARLDLMKKNFGYNIMTYTQNKNGFYTFNDGTTFNYNTQDLTFKGDDEDQYFEVILVSFGENVMSTDYEEVFAHLNLSYTNMHDVYTLFQEKSTPYSNAKYSVNDSIQISEFFSHLSKNKLPIDIQANIAVEPDVSDSSYRNTVATLVQVNGSILLQLTGTPNQFQPKNINTGTAKLQSQYPSIKLNLLASANDMNLYYKQWQKELMLLAKSWIKDSKSQKKVIRTLKKTKLKSVNIAGNSIKV